MSDIAIQVDHVWKKFRKGELHDSLRELIPAMTRRLFGRSPKSEELQDREFWALKDVSFEVKRGESLGIIGPNGAGKSTMLKLLSRIIRPNQGDYKVNGRLSALIEVGAGFHPDLTGRENIYLNGTILGMSKKEIKAKEEQIIDFAGVEAFIETPVKRYSSGMTARLGFAVAAHMEPDVLLVDEVLSVGDARFRTKCLTHMRELVKSNVTVVFISHILEQVRSLCPRTIVLHEGAVHYEGPTSTATQKYLDLLDSGLVNKVESADADIQNIVLTDQYRQPVETWNVREPGAVEFDLNVYKPMDSPSVIVNLSTVEGVYLGTFNSYFDGQRIPGKPGRYHMRMQYDGMPLNDGEFAFDFKVHEFEDQRRCAWAMAVPRRFSVRGGKYFEMPILTEAQWQCELDQPNELKPTEEPRTEPVNAEGVGR